MEIVLCEPVGDLWNAHFSLGENRFDPIQLGYLSAFLKQRGYKVNIIQQRTETDKQVLNKIVKLHPDIVGFSTMTFNFNKARQLARKLKILLPNVKIIFGGYHVSANSESLTFPEIDFLVFGEGEETLADLVDSIDSGNHSDLGKVAGIGYKIDNRLVVTPRRERITNLDSLPFPDRYGMKFCRMGAPMIPIPEQQNNFAQITYSRGCYHNCSFCTSPIMWQQQVCFRSAKNTVDEIEELISTHKTNALFFTDLTFNTDEKRVFELLDEMQRRNINVSWSAACRVTDNISLLQKMRDAGCVRIAYGVESLDDNVLHSLRKGISLDDIIKCFSVTNDLGIITRAYLMMGYPTDNKQSLKYLESTVQQLPADQIRISFITPFPGTRFYDEMKEKNLILSDDFNDYDTERPLIKTMISNQEMLTARDRCFVVFIQVVFIKIELK
jgi:radical SAM superfamily enzyme YgiQ (UPF0313 family)